MFLLTIKELKKDKMNFTTTYELSYSIESSYTSLSDNISLKPKMIIDRIMIDLTERVDWEDVMNDLKNYIEMLIIEEQTKK
jgi:hypothetical protein